MTGNSLEDYLREDSIVLPGSPFWDVFKRFGSDEMCALFVNVLSTAGISLLTNNTGIRSLAGPFIEKVGFFPTHFKDAWSKYRSTPHHLRKPLMNYLRDGCREGSENLIKDILLHDPLYVGLMLAGMKHYPDTPAWMLSATSFLAAIFGVAGIEVARSEAAYWNFKRSLCKQGFGYESFVESKFFVRQNPGKVVDDVSRVFELGKPHILEYEDAYVATKLQNYSGRTPRIRLRKRTRGDGFFQTAQIIYSRAGELLTKKAEQFRYFPLRKDKFFFVLDQEMPTTIDEIMHPAARTTMKNAQDDKQYHSVRFTRTVAHDADKLYIAADEIKNPDNAFYMVEVKTYLHKTVLLKEAMRYIMSHFPVMTQTTQGKFELIALHGK